MAGPTIINQESFGGNLGTNLGQAVGSGLSSGLQQLANQKLERMHKKSIQHDLRSAFPEIPEEAVAFIASKPAKEQLQILETLGQQRQAQQEQQAMAMQQQQASGLQALQQPQESMQQQDMNIPDDHYTPEVIQHLEEQLNSPEATQQFPPEQLEKARANLLAMQEKLSMNPVGANPFPKETEVVKEPKTKGISLTKVSKGEKDSLAREKHELAKEKHTFEKQKLTKEIIQPIVNKKNDAKDRLEDIQRRRELEDEGKMDTSGYNEFLERSGLDINALRQPGSTEYNKTIASAIRGAKEMFGGRATDTDVRLYMKTLPSLSDSPEGRKRIDANLARFANLEIAIAETYIDILRKNPNVLPADLLLEVDEKLDKKRDQVYKQFKKDLERPVPEAQNRLVTAGQAIAGSILGGPGKLLGAIGGFFGKGAI